MTDTFDRAFTLVIGVEGGYANDPRDPGGETKYGISKRSYPTLDIAKLTLDEAKAIYQRDFWSAIQADKLPPAPAIVLFDYAVNSGVGGKVKLMQAAAGLTGSDIDGDIGPGTLAAVTRMGGPKLAAEITAQRILTLAALPSWKIYGRGWARRMAGILAAAIEMDAPAKPATTTYISPMPPLEVVKQAIREVNAEPKVTS